MVKMRDEDIGDRSINFCGGVSRVSLSAEGANSGRMICKNDLL